MNDESGPAVYAREVDAILKAQAKLLEARDILKAAGFSDFGYVTNEVFDAIRASAERLADMGNADESNPYYTPPLPSGRLRYGVNPYSGY
jgi:hypothetical protein